MGFDELGPVVCPGMVGQNSAPKGLSRIWKHLRKHVELFGVSLGFGVLCVSTLVLILLAVDSCCARLRQVVWHVMARAMGWMRIGKHWRNHVELVGAGLEVGLLCVMTLLLLFLLRLCPACGGEVGVREGEVAEVVSVQAGVVVVVVVVGKKTHMMVVMMMVEVVVELLVACWWEELV